MSSRHCDKQALSKCHFAKREVKYLGHIVFATGVRSGPSKIEAVSTYPIPRNVKELQQFTNYYHRFIADYSKVAEPLHRLLTKENNFNWDSKCQDAFEELKHRLLSLAFPDFSQQFLLYMDASDSALGGVLSQIQEGQERVISYWSRQLQKAEGNYSAIEKEGLSAVAAIKKFCPYLYGFNFKLVTDHNLLADEQLAPVINALKRGELLPANSAPGLCKTFIQDILFCRKFQPSSSSAKTQLVVPSNVKATILQQLHDNTGHLGVCNNWKCIRTILVASVNNTMLHSPHQRHHLGLLKQTGHSRRYLAIISDLYLHLQKERSTF